MIQERLRQELDRQGLKVADLAYKARVSDALIYNILNGSDTKISTLTRIARGLGVAVCDLIDENQADGFLERLGNKLMTLDVVAA